MDFLHALPSATHRGATVYWHATDSAQAILDSCPIPHLDELISFCVVNVAAPEPLLSKGIEFDFYHVGQHNYFALLSSVSDPACRAKDFLPKLNKPKAKKETKKKSS